MKKTIQKHTPPSTIKKLKRIGFVSCRAGVGYGNCGPGMC